MTIFSCLIVLQIFNYSLCSSFKTHTYENPTKIKSLFDGKVISATRHAEGPCNIYSNVAAEYWGDGNQRWIYSIIYRTNFENGEISLKGIEGQFWKSLSLGNCHSPLGLWVKEKWSLETSSGILRNANSDLCLTNPGGNDFIKYAPCDDSDLGQYWQFLLN